MTNEPEIWTVGAYNWIADHFDIGTTWKVVQKQSASSPKTAKGRRITQVTFMRVQVGRPKEE